MAKTTPTQRALKDLRDLGFTADKVEQRLPKCSRCKESKPPHEFFKNLTRKRGLDSFCRPCRAAYDREWRLKNRERYRVVKRANRLRNRDRINARARTRRLENPDKCRRVSAAYRVRRPAVVLFVITKHRAKCRGIPFTLTRDWFDERMQAGRCQVSGITFENESGQGRGKCRPWSPSVDRIDRDRGYTPDNCRMVVWAFNMAKSTWTDAVVMRLATALSRAGGAQ